MTNVCFSPRIQSTQVAFLLLPEHRDPAKLLAAQGCVALCCLSRVRLCNPMDYNPPGSSVHGILQAKILEWLAISSSGDLPNSVIKPGSFMSLALAEEFFTTGASCVPRLFLISSVHSP